ncbi:rhodanese-like domain-containing protein [Microbacterium terricola]|nr:rhodanese-like domain-containing protein [Microbacterium terricola]
MRQRYPASVLDACDPTPCEDAGVSRSPLISADDLSELLEAGGGIRLLDVRYRLDKPDGRADYEAGHIPGAVYVDMDTELATHGAPSDGRHPLPSRETLENAARRWGLHDGDAVVVYDDYRSVAAARAWWLLRGAGVVDVRVLDGGLSAWRAAGLPLETGEVEPVRGSILLDNPGGGLSIDEAAAWPRRGVLIDARAPERYRGEIEPYDPVAGHIPGAMNLPADAVLAGDSFASPATIRAAFESVGVTAGTAVAAYCGSGITAAHTALAGAASGIEVAVYPGSWSQWSNMPHRPVATGAQPVEPATSITVDHRFDASQKDVWRAWTDPEIMRLWWGSDPDGVVTSAALDVRPGGRFDISFRDSSGDLHTSSGEYLRVDEPTELEFTWSWLSETNTPSRVHIVLAGDGTGTRMRFVHRELRGASDHDYADGWRRTFAKLDRVLGG